MVDRPQRIRRRRADAERSRAVVLDAAIAVLGRRSDASVEEIAAAAGVARQTVYAHFPSRRDLLTAAVAHLTAETVRTLDDLDLDGVPPDEALRRWLTASWAVIERYPILLSPALADVAPPGDDHHRHAPVTGRLVALVRHGRRTGLFDRRFPEAWIVGATVALGHAAGAHVVAGRMSARQAGAAFTDSVLRLVSADPPVDG